MRKLGTLWKIQFGIIQLHSPPKAFKSPYTPEKNFSLHTPPDERSQVSWTLCEGPETPMQWKSESVTDLQKDSPGQVLEMLTDLQRKIVRLKDDSSARERWCGCEIRRTHKAHNTPGGPRINTLRLHIRSPSLNTFNSRTWREYWYFSDNIFENCPHNLKAGNLLCKWKLDAL